MVDLKASYLRYFIVVHKTLGFYKTLICSVLGTSASFCKGLMQAFWILDYTSVFG